MKLTQTLYSQHDQSVNFIFDNMLEARYVRREKDYFIVYLSSHNGCNKACRFCHLTQTGQTDFDPAQMQDYLIQARTVMQHYVRQLEIADNQATRVNFNFMARGEPLANPVMLHHAKELFDALSLIAQEQGLQAQFNISTIMPQEMMATSLLEVFGNCSGHRHSIYYSLYSVLQEFRKRWLPKASPVETALSQIQQWQRHTNQQAAIHWAFIEGQNDQPEHIQALLQTLAPYEMKLKFNLVRYNPYSTAQGVESSEEVLLHNFSTINQFLNNPASRIVPRVGFDVKASCGMFIEVKALE